MAEFAETMRQWRRMCKKYTTNDESCCDGCPVVDYRENGCGAIFEMEDGIDFLKYEAVITAWAKENPEPVYQSWADYLMQIDVIPACTTTDQYEWFSLIINALENTPVPADIAQKLGLEPKEG